jgi:hypothetical protein
VSGSGDNISVGEGRRNGTSRDKTSGMGHIDEQVGADLIADFSEFLVVDEATVG